MDVASVCLCQAEFGGGGGGGGAYSCAGEFWYSGVGLGWQL